jgi:XTP/dITP diphosphohydrolase
MKKELVFATNNLNKLKEVQQLILNKEIKLLSLGEIGCLEEIPEIANTIEGNARLKAEYVQEKYQMDCFADDTGLEVEVLNGEPGVKSARYAGEEKNNEENIQLLLNNLKNIQNRKAQFKTVISLFINGEYHEFYGIIKGVVIDEKKGEKGFGYDAVFLPDGYDITFAQMSLEEKNKISHRAIAVSKLLAFLNK